MKRLLTQLVLVLALIHFEYRPADAQTSQTRISEAMTRVVEGKQIPDGALLVGVDGDTTFYSELKGQWLLLDYWSATCIPCIKEMPYVNQLQERYANGTLKVIRINLDKSLKRWKKGISKHQIPEPNYRTDRSVSNAFFAINLVELAGEQKPVYSTLMPQYVLISPEGYIMNKEMVKPSDANFDQVFKTYFNENR